MLADAETATPDGVRFSESLMAEHLGHETVLIDVTAGAAGVAEAIDAACAATWAATSWCSPTSAATSSPPARSPASPARSATR